MVQLMILWLCLWAGAMGFCQEQGNQRIRPARWDDAWAEEYRRCEQQRVYESCATLEDYPPFQMVCQYFQQSLILYKAWLAATQDGKTLSEEQRKTFQADTLDPPHFMVPQVYNVMCLMAGRYFYFKMGQELSTLEKDKRCSAIGVRIMREAVTPVPGWDPTCQLCQRWLAVGPQERLGNKFLHWSTCYLGAEPDQRLWDLEINF